MLTQTFVQAKESVISFIRRCKDYAAQCGDAGSALKLSSVCSELEDLSFNIAVVGSVKRGKSTLINALLGQDSDDISPVGVTVCTGAVSKYRNYTSGMAREPHADVYYERNPSQLHRISYTELRGLISQKSNANNEKGVHRIEVYGDFPLLGACNLIDTPGTDAVMERHGELVSEFLPCADAIILPIMAPQTMTNEEQIMLPELSENSKRRIFYVLTKVDRVTPADLNLCEARVRSMIAAAGLPAPDRVYKVNAKAVFEAQKRHLSPEEQAGIREANGITQLENDLSRFITAHSEQGQALKNRLIFALNDLMNYIKNRKAVNESLLANKEFDSVALAADMDKARHAFEVFESNMNTKIGNFSTAWEQMVTDSEKKIEWAAQDVVDAVKTKIDNAGFIANIGNAFNLKALVTAESEKRLAGVCEEIRQRMERIVNKLKDDYAAELGRFAESGEECYCITELLGALTIGGASVASATFVAGSAVASVATAIGAYMAAGTWTVAFKAVALVSALTSAIVPVLIGMVCLLVAGPLTRWFIQYRVDCKVEEAMAKSKEKIVSELRSQGELIKSGLQGEVALRRSEFEQQMQELEHRKEKQNPEARANAERELAVIGSIMQESAEVQSKITALT